MDVRRWLEETTTPGPPASLGLPAGQHAREGAPRDAAKQSSPNRRKSKRSQKHTSSDSSLLRPHRANGQLQPVTQERGNGDRAPQHIASDKAASRYSSGFSGSADRSKSGLYARRPRRKTRLEIYEPKPGSKRRRHDRGNRQGRHAPPRDKDRRRGKSDLPHTFHAKNVAQGRLTLKPSESLGLFKKGRASSPVKGRGLPDLVFSEMRFLQKRGEPADGKPPDEASRKRRKKDINPGQENEISTYFAAQRPALAENDVHIPSAKQPERPPEYKQRKHHDTFPSSIEATSADAPVDLPKKPYLGFGTRRVGSTSTSNATFYIPRPETNRHNSATASQRFCGHSLPLQVATRESDDALACSSNDGAKLSHDEVGLNAHGTVPQEFALPHAVQPTTTVESLHGVFQEGAQDHPGSSANVLQSDSPLPPSSHKHKTYKQRQQVTDVSPRQVVLQREVHGTGTDVNKQQGRHPKHAQTGHQTQHAASRGANDRNNRGTGHAVVVPAAPRATSDAAAIGGPQRSSSPLGRLLRRCDDACRVPTGPRGVLVMRQSDKIDTRYVETAVEFVHSPGRDLWHRTTSPPRGAEEMAEMGSVPFHMQAHEAAIAYEAFDPGCVAVDDAYMPEVAEQVMEREAYEFTDDVANIYAFRTRSGVHLDGDLWHDVGGGDGGGSVCDFGGDSGEQTGLGDSAGDGSWGRLGGFWRPHKLY